MLKLGEKMDCVKGEDGVCIINPISNKVVLLRKLESEILSELLERDKGEVIDKYKSLYPNKPVEEDINGFICTLLQKGVVVEE